MEVLLIEKHRQIQIKTRPSELTGYYKKRKSDPVLPDSKQEAILQEWVSRTALQNYL
jgi:hypothetical protein